MFSEILLTQFKRAISKTRNTGTRDGTSETRGMRQRLYSTECPQTFRGMSLMFGVNEENYLAESHLESCQTSTMELFCENS